MHPRTRIVFFVLAASALACTIPGLPVIGPATPTPYIIPSQPTSPPPPTVEPVPVEADFLSPSFPAYSPDDISAHYQAMLPGFEQDVDAFSGGTRYWMILNLALAPPRIYGRERVRVVNNEAEALDAVVFRLYPNHMVAETVLTVTDTTVDGEAVEGELSGQDTVLRIPLPATLPPGESTEVEMAFSLVLERTDNLVGFGHMNTAEGAVALPSFFPMLSVYEDGAWWEEGLHPNSDPVYSETVLFDVWLRAPTDANIAATGVSVSAENEGEYTLHHFASGPARDFALGVSREYEMVSGDVDGIRVTVWSRPGNAEADRFILDTTVQSLRIFSDEFGPYPFAELDVVEIVTAASGIEYPGLFYLSTAIWDSGDTYTEWVTAHETAHQWWYSMVGNDQVGEPWIDEGVTEYSSEVYFLRVRGQEGADMAHDYFVHHVGDFVAEFGEQLPVGLPTDAYPGLTAYDVFVYSGGALFYDTLVEEYGRDAVGEMLRAFFEQYRYGVAHNEDLEALVAAELDEEAQALFREWVYGDSE